MKLTIESNINLANSTPIRHWDYIATLEDSDEFGTIGYGNTPENAILDLMEKLVGTGELI